MSKTKLAVFAIALVATALSVWEWVTATPDQPHGIQQSIAAVGMPTIAAIALLAFIFFGHLGRWGEVLGDWIFEPSTKRKFLANVAGMVICFSLMIALGSSGILSGYQVLLMIFPTAIFLLLAEIGYLNYRESGWKQPTSTCRS